MNLRDVRVLGIDPGSRTTGWAVVARVSGRMVHVASGVVRTDPEAPMPARLQAIHHGLLAAIETHIPSEVAMEEIFAYRSAASALVLGQARGVALLAVAGLPLSTYNASTIKKSVSGSGKADKVQVSRMIKVVLGISAMLPADETDALAVAVTHLAHAGMRAAGPAINKAPRRMSSRDQWTAIAVRAGAKA
ncbi:MAG: crossover junction endodeoxyribonuclease RuvC [Myxococcales bacterium]|nr:crossover junction endodeoxyribonuclease RuvC [Myxococcales bacterium]